MILQKYPSYLKWLHSYTFVATVASQTGPITFISLCSLKNTALNRQKRRFPVTLATHQSAVVAIISVVFTGFMALSSTTFDNVISKMPQRYKKKICAASLIHTIWFCKHQCVHTNKPNRGSLTICSRIVIQAAQQLYAP